MLSRTHMKHLFHHIYDMTPQEKVTVGDSRISRYASYFKNPPHLFTVFKKISTHRNSSHPIQVLLLSSGLITQ